MPAPAPPDPIAEWTVDRLRVLVFEDRAGMGRAAASEAAGAIASRQAESGRARVVFAAAPSQDEFLAALVAGDRIDWSRVEAFHMDEYLGLAPEHPASFRRYLHEHLFGLVDLPADRLRLIPGERAERPLQTCLDYEGLLRAEALDVVCAGIGENGHLAFNDPPVADFLDPVLIKVVRLDPACRLQQVNDGCFAGLDDVPTHAYTMTVPALLSASTLAVVVPGPRKADAVQAALEGPISESCPGLRPPRPPRRHALPRPRIGPAGDVSGPSPPIGGAGRRGRRRSLGQGLAPGLRGEGQGGQADEEGGAHGDAGVAHRQRGVDHRVPFVGLVEQAEQRRAERRDQAADVVAKRGPGAPEPGREELGEVDRVAAEERELAEPHDRDHPVDVPEAGHAAEEEKRQGRRGHRQQERDQERGPTADDPRDDAEGVDPEEGTPVLEERDVAPPLVHPAVDERLDVGMPLEEPLPRQLIGRGDDDIDSLAGGLGGEAGVVDDPDRAVGQPAIELRVGLDGLAVVDRHLQRPRR